MPATAADEAKAATEAAKQLSAEAQRTFADARAKIEAVVQEGLETLRAQSRAYADTAGEQLEVASTYVTERVRERPLAATGAALGVGVLIGLLLSAGAPLILQKTLKIAAAAGAMAAAAAVVVVAAAFRLYAAILPVAGAAWAAASVAGAFAVIAVIVALIVYIRANPHAFEKEEDVPLSTKLLDLARERPVVATAGAIVASALLVKYPKLLTLVGAIMAGRATQPAKPANKRR